VIVQRAGSVRRRKNPLPKRKAVAVVVIRRKNPDEGGT